MMLLMHVVLHRRVVFPCQCATSRLVVVIPLESFGSDALSHVRQQRQWFQASCSDSVGEPRLLSDAQFCALRNLEKHPQSVVDHAAGVFQFWLERKLGHFATWKDWHHGLPEQKKGVLGNFDPFLMQELLGCGWTQR